jgi:hypothetical protein
MIKNLYFTSGLAFWLSLPTLVYAQKGKVNQLQEQTQPHVSPINGIKVPEVNTPTGPTAEGDVPISVRNIKFGAGFGISTNLQNAYSYALVAPDYTLSKERISRVGGVASGVVMYNKTIYYYRGEDETSEPYSRTYPLSALLAINLASLAPTSTSSATGFNTRLDLGLGIGYRFDEHIQFGLFMDFASQRFLREAYAQYEGKAIPDYKPSQNLTALDPTDDHYFISRTVPSFSFKLILNLTADQPKAKDEQQAKQFVIADKIYKANQAKMAK